MINFLKEILKQSSNKNKLYRRNLVKEYLQILVLDFIYSSPKYNQLIFYGGSSLAHCFDLPRLSEDLDFIDLKKNVNLSELAIDIADYFVRNGDQKPKTTIQKFRIYFKFPILNDLGLAEKGESDFLFIKAEVFKDFNGAGYKKQFIPLFKFNKSILIQTFDLPTLMATKIMAILHRKWEKTNNKGDVLIRAKGRDYFDLWWYLNKNIQPNLKCLKGFKNKKSLGEELLKIIEKVDAKSIRLDLEAFLSDDVFNKNLSKNLKGILIKKIKDSYFK